MTRQSRIYSGNTIELRPSLRSVVRVLIEGMPVLGDVFHRYYLFARRGIACRGVYASHEEAIKGSITPGKLADFTMLAEDPHEVDPSVLKDIQVVHTVMGGRTTHEA